MIFSTAIIIARIIISGQDSPIVAPSVSTGPPPILFKVPVVRSVAARMITPPFHL
ncbi:MAG: hypothetical protein MCM46_04295 [Candidatus Manganitrophus sp. SB1]|nr:hypothetical protein [Candidatus Manganitrophus morganii]